MTKTLWQFVGGCLIAGLFVLSQRGMAEEAKAQQNAPLKQNPVPVQGTLNCSIENGSGYNPVFRPYKRYNCGQRAYGVGTGDFNHDGRTDAATSMETGTGWEHVLLIFLQDSNGVLGQPASYAGGNRSEYLGVGDFNHDGWDDVVTADYDNTISVYLQQADGTLANRVTYPTNTGPDGIAVADVNNDTLDEIVISHWNSPTIGVFTQKADGSLNPMVTYPSAQAGWDDIGAGDLNGDGRMDVVKMNGQGYANPNIMVYLQNEGGTLDAAVTYQIAECPGSCNANSVAVGDVTGDGRDDIVLSYSSYGIGIAVFEQDATGTFLPSVSYPTYGSAGAVGAGDLNSDDLEDVVAVHPGWMRVGVYTQQADGTLSTESMYEVPYGAGQVEIADVDGNGYPDLVMSDSEWGLLILYHRAPSPEALAPSGKIGDTTPTYQWTKVTGATQYRYQLTKGSILVYTKTVPSSVCGTGNCSSTPSTALTDASYKWRVQAMINGRWADFSALKLFSVDAVPTGSAPSGTINDPTPTYKWTKIVGASQYRYQLVRGATLIYTKTVSSSVCGATSCSSTPSNLLADASYKWRVQAMTNGTWNPYSAYKVFTVFVPKAGFWKGTYEEFYVTADHKYVDNFAVYVYVYGCGSYKITHTPLAPILNKHFYFSGSFYANGTFNTTTSASGSEGLSSFFIPNCGYVTGGPWTYSAVWKSASQPLIATAEPSTGLDIATMIEQALEGYRVVKLDEPAP